ncbi:hypothetical protein [Streptomyces paludis]|uniref:hypothetical protein n=1 Tax=Streptomyces paludis TaxID=2282738 RepID=UPI0013B46F2E|nr:hypothetical protein [Streptomyces paludis]
MSQNPSAASPCADLSDAIRAIAPTAVLVRVFPAEQAVTHFYGPDFHRVLVDRESEEGAAHLIRRCFSRTADWRRAHDFHLPSRALYRTPEPSQNGYVPEDDSSFGMASARYIASSGRADS